jgi:molybdopterin converting factor subunit 1
MTVRVHLFARARDLAEAESLRVELASGATIGDLRRALASVCPRLEELLSRSALAVDDEFADESQAVPPGAEIALLPPVSGG